MKDKFDPYKGAQAGEQFDGHFKIAELPRLQPQLVSAEKDVFFQIKMGKDPGGIPFLSGQIQVELPLQCQRCNEPVAYPLDFTFLLSPVSDDEKARRLPECYEPLIVSPGDLVLVREMIEEEILLQLPMIARHELGGCPVTLPEYLAG